MKQPISLLLALALSLAAVADENPFMSEPGPPTPSSVEEGKAWTEALSQMPPWPTDADLVEIALSGAPDPFRYFIDSTHLTVGPDKVVRFTLVAQSSSGTRNLAFEGIRCTPKGQYKVYAYGVSGQFTPVWRNDWAPISEISTERYRADLWRYHFCEPEAFMPRRRSDIIRSLKGRIPSGRGAGFQLD